MSDRNSRLFNLAAETLRGDLASRLRDQARTMSGRPWEKMTADEQRSFCDDCTDIADHILREVVDIVATEGRQTVKAKVAKVDNNGKVIKATLELNTATEGRHELLDAVGSSVNIILGSPEAFEGGDVPHPDKFGALGVPDPESEYTEADGHGVPDPAEGEESPVWPEEPMDEAALVEGYRALVGESLPHDNSEVVFVNWRQPEAEDGTAPDPVYVAIGEHAETAVAYAGLALDEVAFGDDTVKAAFVYEADLEEVAGKLNAAEFNMVAFHGGENAQAWPMPQPEAPDETEAEAANDGGEAERPEDPEDDQPEAA